MNNYNEQIKWPKTPKSLNPDTWTDHLP
eukprot:UN10634